MTRQEIESFIINLVQKFRDEGGDLTVKILRKPLKQARIPELVMTLPYPSGKVKND